jgi:CheY-like chemotaxis protein
VHAPAHPPERPGRGERAVEIIERNARNQARLVDDLLDATRMQAGKLHLEFMPVPLEVPVRAALDAVRPAAEARGIRLHLESTPPVPVVSGDIDRLQQVAANLLVNAVKFTPRGGNVRVSVLIAEGRARLVVADDGEGIDAGFLPHVFTRFRQADSSAARRHGGLGLGLTIVSSLARLHGGEVEAASDGPGRGTTFTVTFPLSSDPAVATTEATRAAAGEAPGTAATLSGLRILVVDDEPDVRAVVSGMLEQLGAEVVPLESGESIEPSLASFQPHLMLVDIGMPGEDGYALMRRVRRLAPGRGGDVPAVSLTAHARNEDRARAMASGFQDHLPKPIDLPLLVATVRRLAELPGGAA